MTELGKDKRHVQILEEDGFMQHMKANWKQLGMTPVMLKLLVEWKQWPFDMVDDCFGDPNMVGPDYADIKMTEWFKRLEELGYEFPDGKPVIKVLQEIMIEFWGGDADRHLLM
jgi:hypothetical protein